MLKCDKCGLEFEDDATIEIIERHTERHSEVWGGCPSCGCISLEELHKCPCGENYVADGKRYCCHCRRMAMNGIGKIFESVELSTNDAIDLIDDILAEIEKENR